MRRRLIPPIALTIAAAAAVALTLAAPAGATVRAAVPAPVHTTGGFHAIPSVHLPPTHLPGHRMVNAALHSNNWTGYAVTELSGHAIPEVAATFTVPDVNCAGTPIGSVGATYVADWAGLDGITDGTVEQEGVDAVCTSTSGPATYYAWYEMFPLDPVVEGTVSPGDAIEVETRHVSSGWELALTDVNSGGSFATIQPCPSGSVCDDSSAEMITEDPGGAVAGGVNLADFGEDLQLGVRVVDYRGALLPMVSESGIWTQVGIGMFDPSGVLMASAGGQDGGEAWADYFHTGT